MTSHVVTPAVFRKQTLHASVMRACQSCGAPGFYHDTRGVNVGCYDPDRLYDPVGEVCPNCGAVRSAVEHLGVIWSREWRAKLWPTLIETAKNLFNRRRKR